MKIDEIMKCLEALAQSQGFYSRYCQWLRQIREDFPERWEDLVKELESQNFKDAVDLVIYLEG